MMQLSKFKKICVKVLGEFDVGFHAVDSADNKTTYVECRCFGRIVASYRATIEGFISVKVFERNSEDVPTFNGTGFFFAHQLKMCTIDEQNAWKGFHAFRNYCRWITKKPDELIDKILGGSTATEVYDRIDLIEGFKETGV